MATVSSWVTAPYYESMMDTRKLALQALNGILAPLNTSRNEQEHPSEAGSYKKFYKWEQQKAWIAEVQIDRYQGWLVPQRTGSAGQREVSSHPQLTFKGKF